MRTTYLICARRVIRDAQENDVSIIGVIEDFAASGFPVVFPRLSVIWAISKEDGDADRTEARVEISEGRAILQPAPVAIDFQGQRGTRVIITITGVAVNGPGVLTVAMSVGNEVRASYAINVAGMVLEGGAPPPPGGAAYIAA
jgi:hypothetical protein